MERRAAKERKSGIFLSILKTMLIIIPVPIVVLIAVELLSVNMIQHTAEDYEKSIMEKALSEFEYNFRNINQTILNVKNDELIRSYVRQTERNYYDEWRIKSRLQKFSSMETAVDELYIYFADYDYVISARNSAESSIWHGNRYDTSYKEWYDTISQTSGGRYRVLLEKDGKAKYILSSSIGTENEPWKCQLVVQLNGIYFQEQLKQLCFSKDEQVFLFYKNGLIAGSQAWDDPGLVEEKLKEVIDEGRDNQIFEGIRYDIRKYTSDKAGITLVSASPQKFRHAAAKTARGLGGLSLVLCLAMLVCVCYYVADKNYSPIRYLIDIIEESDAESEFQIVDYASLEKYVRNSQSMRQRLKQKLEEYEEDVKTYQLGKLLFKGICQEGTDRQLLEWGFSGTYFAVLLVVFETTDEYGIFEAEEEDTWKREMLETHIREQFPELSAFHVLEENEYYYCLLNGNWESREAAEAAVEEYRIQLKNSLTENEGFDGILYGSSVFAQLDNIHTGYEQVQKLWENRINSELFREEKQQGDCNLEKILEMIEKNLSDVNLSVSAIAEEMGITPSYLSRFFKARMEMGVLEYIHGQRIEQAKKMLAESEKNKIREVAGVTGFYNISTFIRVFKKCVGMTPGQYQEKMCGK